jgi:hypothetical protein
VAEEGLETALVRDLEENLPLSLPKLGQELDSDRLQHGLAKLVLMLVNTITDVLERQAVRKVESGTLTSQEVERLGLAFMEIRARTAEIADKFGLRRDELAIELSAPAGKQATLVDVVDKLIDQGTVIAGDVGLAVAGIDLAKLRVVATLTSK